MKKNIAEIINVSNEIYDNGLVSGKAGNVSKRIKGSAGDIIAITPTLKSLSDLKQEDIVLVDTCLKIIREQATVILAQSLRCLWFPVGFCSTDKVCCCIRLQEPWSVRNPANAYSRPLRVKWSLPPVWPWR